MVRGLSAVLAVFGAALAYFLIAPSLPALDHEDAAVLVAGACGLATVGACGIVLAGAWDEPFVLLTLALGAGMIGASLTDVDAAALENVTKAIAATALGLLLAFALRSPAALLGVALLVLGIDLVSALSGPAESLVRGRSESVEGLGLALPRWGSEGVVEVGVPGLVFLGFYLGCAWRFDFRRALTAVALLAGLVAAVAFAVEADRPVPVMAGLSLAILLSNLDRIPRALRSEFHGSARGSRLAPMDLEEHTLETVSERCEECGAALTDEELALALESGGPSLCSIHLAEVVPVEDDDPAEESE